LYRNLMRAAREIPEPRAATKTLYNVREIFSFYKTQTDSQKIQRLLEQGTHDLRVLTALNALDNETIKAIYTSFDRKENQNW